MAQQQGLRQIPQPQPAYLLQNMVELKAALSLRDLMDLAKQYGPIYRLATPDYSQVVLSGFDLVNEVCDDTRFDKDLSPLIRKVRDVVGDGLFTAWTFEPNWGKAHRILLPSFGPKAIQGFIPQMLDIAEQLIQKWERLNSDETIDVPSDMTRLTLDTVGVCGFDYRFNSFYRERPHPFVQSLVRALTAARELTSGVPIDEQLRQQLNQQNQEDIDFMNGLVDKIIADRKGRTQSGSQANDLLNAMLHGIDRKTDEGLSDQNIRYQIITFLIAGHETTSSLLSWAIYFLLNNPAVLARATDEVDRVLGRDPLVRPTLQQVNQLDYVAQILKESLRLVPPAPGFSRYAYEDTVIGGQYAVKKGEDLRVLTTMLHRDQSIWGSNPEVFDPDRFAREAEAARSPNAWKPFGTGQRACIGRQFAMQEATMVLGMILQRFTLIDYAHYQPVLQEVGALKPADFHIKVEKRPTEARVTAATTPVSAPAPAPMAAPKPSLGSHHTPLLVLFGSNTGTSDELAHRIGDVGEANGFATTVAPLDDFARRLPTEGVVVIVTASYNGNPPDNAVAFCNWLRSGEPAGNALRGVCYAVFGCGNHEWGPTYQAVPRLVDDSLAALGAERLYQRGEGDAAENLFDAFDEWFRGLRQRIVEVFFPGVQLATVGPETLYTLEVVSEHATHPLAFTYGALAVQTVRAMRVAENRELNRTTGANPANRSTKHIEVALPPGQTYRTGDHFGVVPFNRPELVHRVAERFGLDGNATVRLHTTASGTTYLPTNTNVRIDDLLSAYVELQQVATRRQVGVLANYTQCPPEKARLLALVDDDDASRANFKEQVGDTRKSLIDLLEEFPACELPLEAFLGMLPRLSPRYYSVSSSPLVEATRCSITVGVVDGPARSGRGNYHGASSSYLDSLGKGDGVFAFVRDPNSNFRLPEDPRTPIIMVGPGTGLAPFRGFLQERYALKARGKTVGSSLLFFGCRNPDQDFLYKDELESFVQQGVTELFTAFSRVPGQKKTYVQDRIKEEQNRVWQLLQEGAIIYVCGDAGRMAPEVQQAFAAIYRQKTAASRAAADTWLADMLAQGRYRIDVWGAS